MKLIEALKKIKELQIKWEDMVSKVRAHCAVLSFETPVYKDQKRQVDEWIQAHSDICKEILKLHIGIQRTNLSVEVTIELGSKQVTKTIAEWIHRRRSLAAFEMGIWSSLTDRNLKEGNMPSTQQGGAPIEVRIVRYFDPAVRDSMIELYRNEPSIIDRTLEVINATTDVVE